jgi:hypothetical protein
MLAYPLNHPAREANDLRSTLLRNAYKVPANQGQNTVDAINKHLRELSAESDNWDNFEHMLNPREEPIANRLSRETAEAFVINLSKDRYLSHYLRKTSRQMLTSQPVDISTLRTDAA